MTWRPAHEAHAIERATLTLNFAQEVPTKALNSAVLTIEQAMLAQGFQHFTPPQANDVIIVKFGGIEPVQSQSEGRGFQIIRAGELIEEFVFHRSHFSYSTTRYTRWKPVIERIATLAGPAISKLMDISNISSLKIEYFDRFVFEGQCQDADYKAAFNTESKYLPRFYGNMKDLWHSHVGYFETTAAGYQRLINANIDVLDVVQSQEMKENVKPKRSIGIYTMIDDRFLIPNTASAPTKLGDILTIADDIHTSLKNILGEIISPTLAELISLDARGH